MEHTMGKQYETLTKDDIKFIQVQKLFYIASCSNKEVNLSPKGYNSIKVLSDNQLIYLDFPGSGNRTARDIENKGKITLLFTAFEGSAKILRLFCKGSLINRNSEEFKYYATLFPDFTPDALRRFILFDILTVESSCGLSVPYFQYQGNREELKNWAEEKANNKKIEEYIEKRKTPPDIRYS